MTCQPQRAKSRDMAASEKPEGLWSDGPLGRLDRHPVQPADRRSRASPQQTPGSARAAGSPRATGPPGTNPRYLRAAPIRTDSPYDLVHAARVADGRLHPAAAPAPRPASAPRRLRQGPRHGRSQPQPDPQRRPWTAAAPASLRAPRGMAAPEKPSPRPPARRSASDGFTGRSAAANIARSRSSLPASLSSAEADPSIVHRDSSWSPRI